MRPVGAELFYADRRRDMTKLIAAFRNYANASNKNIPTVKSPLVQRSLTYGTWDEWKNRNKPGSRVALAYSRSTREKAGLPLWNPDITVQCTVCLGALRQW